MIVVLCPEPACRQPRFGPYTNLRQAQINHGDTQRPRDFVPTDQDGLRGYAGWCDGSHVPDRMKLRRVIDQQKYFFAK